MTDVIKKGLLEVKKRGRFGGYKAKYVLLSNSGIHNCKTVELLDPDGSKSSLEVIRLTDVWNVQDKPSRTRYAFELIMGEDPVITFSCATVVEREEWSDAFRVLNQMAIPTMDTQIPSSPPTTEYFPVTLLKNRSALEIGHSGQYLLSITASAIVLHWRTGAIAHHWSTKNISKLYHPGTEGRLLLMVKRVSGSGPPMDFEFETDKERAVQILRVWNVKLLESIPGVKLLESIPGNPQKLSEISSSLTTAVTAGGNKIKRNRKAKSFKDHHHTLLDDTDDPLKRASSFSRFSFHGTAASINSSATPLSQGSQPLPRLQDTRRTSWNDFPDSQDSYFSRYGPGGISPPPLPPRPVESSSDEDDPDYAYIDEREVKGPGGTKRTPSDELDDQLNELRKSISRENKAKKREKLRAQTLRRYPTSPQFVAAEPEDYLVPVPSKRSQSQSTSSDFRDLSDPSNSNAQELSLSSNECSPVFVNNPPSLPPRVRNYGVNENVEHAAKDYSEPAPPIPPRSPTKEFISRQSSSSSTHSAGSANHRCPKCYSLKKSKSSVSKTVSLEHPTRQSKEESRKSMPNLDHEFRHKHTCSEPAITHSREYLQLVNDGQLTSELDLLSSCLQTLEGLSKNHSDEATSCSPAKKKRNPYDHIQIRSEEAPRAPNPPPRQHRPLTSSQSVYLSHAHTLGGRGHRPTPGSMALHSSLGSAPPVPPRSTVSLSQQLPGSNGIARSPRLGRSATLHKTHTHHPPTRSSSVIDHVPTFHGNTPYSYNSGSQMEPSSSSTVFIHHLKDRRLAHMV